MLEDDLQLSDSEESDIEQVSVGRGGGGVRRRRDPLSPPKVPAACPNLCLCSFLEPLALTANVQAAEKPLSPSAPPRYCLHLSPSTPELWLPRHTPLTPMRIKTPSVSLWLHGSQLNLSQLWGAVSPVKVEEAL